MGTLTVNATNGQTVAKGATYLVPFPAGKSAGNYLTTGAKITTSDGSVYPVTVSFGASGITVTNPTGRDISSGGFDFIDLQTSGVLARFNAAGETEVLIGPKNTEAGLVSSITDPVTGGSALSAGGNVYNLSNGACGKSIALLGDSIFANSNYQFVPDSIVRASGTATVTYAAVHGLSGSGKIRVYGLADTTFNAESVEITWVSTTVFTYPSPGADGSAAISATFTRVMALNNPVNTSIFLFANAAVSGKLNLIGNFGQSSETSTMILARIRQVIDSGAKEAWVMAGTNDPGNSVPIATTKANLKSIYAQLTGYGIVVRAFTILPLGAGHASLAVYMVHYQQVNEWIRQYARTNRGVIVVDSFSAVTDPSAVTGAAKANTLQADNVHPQTYGAELIGQRAALSYTGQLSGEDILTKSQSDTYTADAANPNIWQNAPWTNTGGSIADVITGTAATGFRVASAGNAGRAGVASCPARSDGFGYDQQVSFTPAAASDSVTISVANTGTVAARVAAGEEYRLRFNYSLSGVSASNLSYMRCTITLICGGTTFSVSPIRLSTSGATNMGGLDLADQTVESPSFKIPAGACTYLDVAWQCSFAASGTALTFKLGRVSLDRVQI